MISAMSPVTEIPSSIGTRLVSTTVRYVAGERILGERHQFRETRLIALHEARYRDAPPLIGRGEAVRRSQENPFKGANPYDPNGGLFVLAGLGSARRLTAYARSTRSSFLRPSLRAGTPPPAPEPHRA